MALPEIANSLSCWIVQQLKPEIVLRRREIKEIRKVAMIAPYLTNIKHPPTLMALQQAENLRQIGYEVDMYSAQEMRGPDFEHYLGCHSSPSEPQFVTAGWGQFLGQGARVNTGDMRFSLLQRWRSLLGQMALSDPDLVMFVGLYSGLAAAVFPMRPLLSLGINSVSPMLPADVWLTAQPELDARLASQWTKAFPESQAYYHSYRVRRPHLDREYSRSILGLDEGCLLWVTLVSESESRISGEWAHAMLTLLNKHAHVHWLIVGGNGAVPSALHTARAEQVRCIAFCADAVKYLTVSDIYVNPPMMGGGFAVAESMALGIPALSLSGSDGGDKLGKYAQPDMRTYFQTLQSWMQHPEQRKSTGLLMQQHFNDHLDLAKAPSGLKVACELAVERYAMRKA
ncbi:MAG: glycosyltransferase [Burkholderiales bacterium]|nr:glycosyltransferase [Burkholderiales bacterium]